MIPNQFDYIIIGSGLAGLQLALSLSRDEYFQNKKESEQDGEEEFAEEVDSGGGWERGLRGRCHQ